MYNEEELARPYARALAEAADALGVLDRVRADIEALALQWEACEALRDWCRAFRSQPRAAHKTEVAALWGDSFAPQTRMMLEALAVNGALAVIPHVVTAFRRLADSRQGRVAVSLVFAADPAAATVSALTERAKAAYGPGTAVTVTVDPALGAGLIVRAGNKQIDGTLVGRLRRLRRAFARSE